MLSYLNVHAVLEERRKEARTAGPSVRLSAAHKLPSPSRQAEGVT